MPKTIQIDKEDVELRGTFLYISERISLDYLYGLIIEIETMFEGTPTAPLEELYGATENNKHCFLLPVSCQLEIESISLYKIESGQKMAVGVQLYFTPAT